MSGFLLINKEPNMTSFDVVSAIKRKFKTGHVGHAGTLDPFATGLLVVATNKACKFLSYVESDTKVYEATLKLGEDTDTLDLEGKVIDSKPFNHVTIDLINNAIQSFKGNIEQVPPMYSALKINGKKLYELAREGKEVERKSRQITIYDLVINSFDGQNIVFTCRCSKGTYIRTLGNDIAHALNTCGHLVKLERKQIGNLSLKDAKKLDEIDETDLRRIEDTLSLPKLVISDPVLYRMTKNGMTVKLNSNEEEVMLVDEKDNIIAIYYKNNDYYKCRRGY